MELVKMWPAPLHCLMSWGPKFQPLDLRDPKILRKHLDINLIHLCLARVSIYSERHVESLRKRDGVR